MHTRALAHISTCSANSWHTREQIASAGRPNSNGQNYWIVDTFALPSGNAFVLQQPSVLLRERDRDTK